MSETPTPKPGELWRTNAGTLTYTEDGWRYNNPSLIATRSDQDRITPIARVGHTVAYVETLRARAEAEKWRFAENVIAERDGLRTELHYAESARDNNVARANVLAESVRIAREERDEAVARADQLAIDLDEKVARLVDRNNLLVESLESAEATLKAEQENWLAGDLPTITEREPWSVLRAAAGVMADDGQWVSPSQLLRDTADRLEREAADTAMRDRLIEESAKVIHSVYVQSFGDAREVAVMLADAGLLAEAVSDD